MHARIDTIPSAQRNTEQERLRNESLARRASTGILIGTLALGLTGCEDGYHGTIEETRDVLGDSTIAQCLDGGPYDIDGDGAEWSDEYSGEYHKGSTNAIIEITPEEGGKTLILEQTMSSIIRPADLVTSPYTDVKLLKKAGCDPADLKEYTVDYRVRANAKKLKEHGMTPPVQQ